MSYDAIVIGLGGVGSAAAAHLARRGLRVLGIEQHGPAHALGSSHGRSRIIRQAYMEGPAYVPLVLRAYELWRQLEERTAADLLHVTGGLMIGEKGSRVVDGSVASARQFGIEHELLTAGELTRRFPVLSPSPGTVALYERQAGVLVPEACVHAHLLDAAAAGAELRFGVRVSAWEAGRSGCTVQAGEQELRAERLVITAGPWSGSLLGNVGQELEVSREIMYWFEPEGGAGAFLPGSFPIWMWETGGNPVLYGFPALDGPEGGVKVALHHAGLPTDPDEIDRQVTREEIEAVRAALRPLIPTLAGEVKDAVTCMYTSTRDEHFLIGRHPLHERVAITAGLSGHGFKFASVLGEVMAELTVDGASRQDLSAFAFDRTR